jgi:hypothetical protein
MWMCDPEILCQKHLCGEHVEMHMFAGALKKRKKVSGYIKNNCFEPRSLFMRHDELSKEMIKRGYNHKSCMREEETQNVCDLPTEEQYWEIDRKKSLMDLISRCPKCKERLMELWS